MTPKTPVFWTHGPSFYRPMVHRHMALWENVLGFADRHGVQSILEVGCGAGHMGAFVPTYHGIDLNANIVAAAGAEYPHATFTAADWLSMDIAPLTDRFDLFLACGVIEHCPAWRPFLDRALAVKTRLISVSFSMPMDRMADLVRRVAPPACRPYYTNRYSRPLITRWLADRGLAGKDTWSTYPYATGTDTLLALDMPPSTEGNTHGEN